MYPRDINQFNHNRKERFAVSQIKDFINSNQCLEGTILVLYGLRRTGKTTMMEQAVYSVKDNKKCAFYQMQNQDDWEKVEKMLVQESAKGTEVLCLDEITKVNDFLSEASLLSDVFAKTGMKIIITGTDSLGFLFADNDELFGRTIWVNTTYIPFAEHSEVLGIKDIDDYISFGGLMRKGEPKERFVHDYNSAKKYIDEAVSGNISYSISKISKNTELKQLSEEDFRTIIEKMVEIYSGTFDKESMTRALSKSTVNFPVRKLIEIETDEDIIRGLISNSRNITRDFSTKIHTDCPLSHDITDSMIQKLQDYLFDLQVLSSTSVISFDDTDFGWKMRDIEREYYIVQPAIKYYHLDYGKNFIQTEDYYRDLSAEECLFMQDKLDEKIKGDMLEQIVLFDVQKSLDPDNYEVLKPIFYKNGRRTGEYDMLIYDKMENAYWDFEIKHTKNPFSKQGQHLLNPDYQDMMDYKYGTHCKSCVLYRGDSFISSTDIVYLNVNDFLIAANETKDIYETINRLSASLPIRDLLIEEKEIIEEKEVISQNPDVKEENDSTDENDSMDEKDIDPSDT